MVQVGIFRKNLIPVDLDCHMSYWWDLANGHEAIFESSVAPTGEVTIVTEERFLTFTVQREWCNNFKYFCE